MANDHDKRYKRLFKNPGYLKQLLVSFVDEPFVAEIDFNSVQTIDKSFVSESFRERESDIIYKIKFRNREIYIYLLLEFQSTVDRFMALRMLRYVLELYEDIIASCNPEILPPVFPLMLYNGDRKWTAPENIHELIESSISSEYIPDFKYFKIAENEFSRESLLNIRNAMGSIFLVENLDKSEIDDYLEIVFNILKTEEKEIVTEFIRFIRHYFSTNQKIHEAVDEYDDFEKGGLSMLANTIESWKEELLLTGEQKGIQKGIRDNTIETATKMLMEGFDLKTVHKITGLSVQEIEKLKK
jgi:predicted transposase/invertase (TIGR01784 family)